MSSKAFRAGVTHFGQHWIEEVELRGSDPEYGRLYAINGRVYSERPGELFESRDEAERSVAEKLKSQIDLLSIKIEGLERS